MSFFVEQESDLGWCYRTLRRACFCEKLRKMEGGGGIRTHEITVLQTVALGRLATPPQNRMETITIRHANFKKIKRKNMKFIRDAEYLEWGDLLTMRVG